MHKAEQFELMSTNGQLKFHPVAERLPLNEPDIERLMASIKEHGQAEEITLTPDGLVADGRNRAIACERLGIEPKTVVDETLTDEAAVIALSLRKNGDRRDLTKAERACWAALDWDAMGMNGKGHGAGRGKKESKNGLFFGDHCDAYKVGKSYGKKALAILNHWNAEKLRGVLAEPTTFETVYEEMRKEKTSENNLSHKLRHYPELAERVANGSLKADEAIVLANRYDEEKRERARAQKLHLDGVRNSIKTFVDLSREADDTIAEALEDEEVTLDAAREAFAKIEAVLSK